MKYGTIDKWKLATLLFLLCLLPLRLLVCEKNITLPSKRRGTLDVPLSESSFVLFMCDLFIFKKQPNLMPTNLSEFFSIFVVLKIRMFNPKRVHFGNENYRRYIFYSKYHCSNIQTLSKYAHKISRLDVYYIHQAHIVLYTHLLYTFMHCHQRIEFPFLINIDFIVLWRTRVLPV